MKFSLASTLFYRGVRKPTPTCIVCIHVQHMQSQHCIRGRWFSHSNKNTSFPETLMSNSKNEKVSLYYLNCKSVTSSPVFSPSKVIESQRRCFSCSGKVQCLPQILPGEIDRYQGVWVDLEKLDKNIAVDALTEAVFDKLLKASVLSWQSQGLTSAWLHIPISQGKLLTIASKYGFTFHHAEGTHATLALWMDSKKESKIPLFATHQVGVSGMVIKEDTREILVVKDKNRPHQLWKFPGGLSDLGEDIATTAEREVFEETGLKTEFQSVFAFRQQHNHPGAFGRSDLYILCRLKPLTFDLHPCEEEIAACQWMSIEQLKEEIHTSSLTHRLIDLVQLGLREGFQRVDITSDEMASIYKGLKFHIFHRPLKY